MKAAVILGAGFSKNSGLPVQSEIPRMLIQTKNGDLFGQAVAQVLEEFMKNIFGWDGNSSPPNLDDLFTCIDISTNSGHHLGIRYSPLHLRAIRRMLVYRVFDLLEGSFDRSEDVICLLKELEANYSEVNYVILNWDTVLERYLTEGNPPVQIDYCNAGIPWHNDFSEFHGEACKLVKVHGSSNWLYCDNCRHIFNDYKNEVDVFKRAGFQEWDLRLFEELNRMKDYGYRGMGGAECPVCSNTIASHIATFSYRKSFRANSFSDLWKTAEAVLTEADRWIFIGYSLPDADYEFKHLLKISEMKLEHLKKDRLSIDVVLSSDGNAGEKYKKFFGRRIHRISFGGIKQYLEQGFI